MESWISDVRVYIIDLINVEVDKAALKLLNLL